MRNQISRLKLILIFLFISGLTFGQETAGLVVYVSDGDTFHLKIASGEKLKVRVADIDCPERTQSYGLEAKAFVMEQIMDKEILIHILKTDRYGRKVARVKYDAKDLSEELIKNGLAWHYKQYSNDPALEKLEMEARQKGEKIWSDKNPIAPWEFRKNKNISYENNN